MPQNVWKTTHFAVHAPPSLFGFISLLAYCIQHPFKNAVGYMCLKNTNVDGEMCTTILSDFLCLVPSQKNHYFVEL